MKTVLITGCSSGFGYLTAKFLGDLGYTVYPTVRKKKDLGALAGAVLLDVTWPQEKLNRVVNKIGRIDVLINNAGFGFLGGAATFSEKQVREQFETNFFGTFKMIKAVLPQMRSQKSGLIINISSISGLVTTAYYGIYSASKFALEALSMSLRAEEHLNGIHVTAVNPGSFATKFWRNERFPSPSKLQALTNHRFHRRADPMEVVYKIKEIIETPHPGRNYLIGLDAHLVYFLARFLPVFLQDWLVKFLVRRLA